MPTTGPDRAEAAFWATYLRNRNVDVATAHDGAVAVAGGYAICAARASQQVALAVGSSRPLDDDDIAVLEAFYRSRGVPVRIEIGATALERDRALLERHGFTLEDDGAYAFYETTAAPDAANDGVAVHLAHDRPSWVRLMANAFAGDAAPDERRMRSIELCGAAAAAVFIAELGGVPAGGGALGICGEHALLYCGAVLAQHRGRGVHRALVDARVAEARTRGFVRAAMKVAIGSASERSARAAGFDRVLTTRRLRRA